VITIRPAVAADQAFWFSLDTHLPTEVFAKKIMEKTAYVVVADDQPVGLLRYNFFWDTIPFCTMLVIEKAHQGKGIGKRLVTYWEQQQKAAGHALCLTSTQVDEQAQHFYRKLGYQDAGGLLLTSPGFEQPMELFLVKQL